MATRQVAIDVGATVVRVAEVELRGGDDPRAGAALTAYAERALPAGVMREGQVEEPGAFSSAVKEALSAAKVKPKKAILAIGHPSVVVREVDVPTQSMSEVRASLAFHVQDSLPMAVDDALLDFYPSVEIETQSGPMLRGLLVAAPREFVRGLISGLDEAGIGPARIDHKAFALWRGTVRGELMTSNVATVDVGAETTTVVVSQHGSPRLVRVLPQGGSDATKAIASAFKGASIDAEALKFQIGMNPNVGTEQRPVAEAVAHVMSPLIDSIRNTLVYFASSNPGAGAERIVLSGGGAYMAGFGQALSSATRLPVMIGDPMQGAVVSKKVDAQQFRGREATLATVVGLAMGGAA
ncbi:type IV pilus assembly protein PilM [Demequina activiva]|uniref:Cell division protein FtsA n=1 Tax=Demequina activiva TaxID=1582364 RepID=A0A919Q489_9MICO|nr:type IV pilus assembly protein PilM [Demequina activiva]GIG54621.1 cell division protein FtsA [Demequina activiva]